MDIKSCSKLQEYFYRYKIISKDEKSFLIECKNINNFLPRVNSIKYEFYIDQETKLVELNIEIYDENNKIILYQDALIYEQKFLIYEPGRLLLKLL